MRTAREGDVLEERREERAVAVSQRDWPERLEVRDERVEQHLRARARALICVYVRACACVGLYV